MHYKDQFKLPPEPLNLDFDQMIRMMKHCFNSETEMSLLCSCFNLVKLSDAEIILKPVNKVVSKVYINGYHKISIYDKKQVSCAIRKNYPLVLKMINSPNIFNCDK